jgi:Zn-dependent protease with chaperone function
MNSVRHQDQAERTARRLIGLFALATAAVVLASNALALALWQLLQEPAPPHALYVATTGAVLALILGGAWLETTRLRDDGARIARRLGAVPVNTDADPLQRRLQNLLEELSIAARIGVPRAFVLHQEPSINAFTAGLDPNHTVVAVTRGALERLTREQLQGVLAHEIAHVVNGDVRLNTRLAGLSYGLERVAALGRMLRYRASARGGPGAPLALAGAVLSAAGAIGELAARAVRAGMGRQREFFADAQAVELTRDRDGLGGALRRIAGQRSVADARDGAGGLRHPLAAAVGHLLLVAPDDAGGALSTHPPLEERLRRLYGEPVEPLACDDTASLDATLRHEPDLPVLAVAATAVADEPGHAIVPEATAPNAATLHDASLRLVRATREPAAAAALVVALIEDGVVAAPAWDEGWAVAAVRFDALRASVEALPAEAMRSLRWPLMELAVARLRPLSRPARESLLATARGRLGGERRVMLREWIYFSLLRLRLAPSPAVARLPGLADPIDARSVRVLFALVAQAAQVSEARAERAANAAIRALDGEPIGGAAGPLTPETLERALRRAARLAPLERPLLVHQLVALLPPEAGGEVRDFLRLLCVAIDCPPPQFPPRGRVREDAATGQAEAGQPSTRHATV